MAGESRVRLGRALGGPLAFSRPWENGLGSPSALRSGFRSRRAAAAFREAQASASQSEAPETAPFVEKKQSRPALLLVVRTVSAAEEQELLRYRWLSSGLLRSAAC
jgi:hypothetical protein